MQLASLAAAPVVRTAAEATGDPEGFGLGAAALIGVVLVAGSVWLRSRTKSEVRAADVALGLLPFVAWLLASGQISKFGFAGVEFEVKEAILDATREPVAAQVTSVESVMDEVQAADRGAKGAPNRLPDLVRRRIEALEFHLGRGGYYDGGVIAEYFRVLGPREFFRYVLVFDEQRRLFGLFEKHRLMEEAERQAERDDGRGAARERPARPGFGDASADYGWFADLLNRGGRESGERLASVPGFVPGDAAVDAQVDKREALRRMERLGSSILPVVDPGTGEFVGVVERSRLTASLILDIAGGLEAIDPR